MPIYWTAALSAFLLISTAGPALACRPSRYIDLEHILLADVVVIGRITNYEIVLDPVARQERQRLIQSLPDIDPLQRKRLKNQTRFHTDYGRFDIEVDEILKGPPAKRLSVVRRNPPELVPSGQFLIALQYFNSVPPPGPPMMVRVPDGGTKPLFVLQHLCAPAFMLESKSGDADAARDILRQGPIPK